jgi:hypothetical protein
MRFLLYIIMKYLIDFSEFTLENNNKKYQGDFIKSLNGWDITYSDYPGHYITDKLQDRSKSKIEMGVRLDTEKIFI